MLITMDTKQKQLTQNYFQFTHDGDHKIVLRLLVTLARLSPVRCYVGLGNLWKCV